MSKRVKNINTSREGQVIITVKDTQLFWEVKGLELDLVLALLERVKYEILKRLDGKNAN